MRKPKFFFIMTVLGILCLGVTSWAQAGYRAEEEWEVTSSRQTVKVYGPDVLTKLAARAIQEERPDVAIETYYKPLKNKVWIEGTTGNGYMSLSPQRVDRLQAARAKGGSVYSALCTQQKGVIQKTVGEESDWVRVEPKKSRARRYVRTICPPAPAILVPFVPMVNVGVIVGSSYRFHGYRAYGIWGHHRYHYGRGFRSFHRAYRSHHASRSFHRGRR
jgi:hypothetical protein